jgi:hypothetical protein
VFVLDRTLDDLEPRFVRDWSGASAYLACAVEALASQGLPSFAVENLKAYLPPGFKPPAHMSGPPGVLGLVVAVGSATGFVVPLRCRLGGSSWDQSLPFDRESVLDVLVRLAGSAGLSTAGVVPERLEFTFENPLGRRASGNSMTVAAALSVLGALNDPPSELLSCACALVEPDEAGGLRPVEYIAPKLQAVVREHGCGSLLICSPNCQEVDGFRSRFRFVWEVSSTTPLQRRFALTTPWR